MQKMGSSKCWLCGESFRVYYAAFSDCEHKFHFWCLMHWTSENTYNHKCPCPVESCTNHFDSINIMRKKAEPLSQLTKLKNLQCGICLEVITSPTMLMRCCGQGFCLNCAQRALKVRSECPLDRTTTYFANFLVWNEEKLVLIKNEYVGSRKSLNKVSTLLSPYIQCGICKSMDNNEDLNYCYLCSACFHRDCAPPQCLILSFIALCLDCYDVFTEMLNYGN